MQDKPAKPPSVPGMAKWLGYAGLLPQLIALVLVVRGGALEWIALASSYAYAALIFSFLGGVWWGQAVTTSDSPKWIYGAAVLPSLIGLALFLPWTFGSEWPGPSLLWLGLAIVLSPLVDRKLGWGGGDWLTLRWRLSLGLGGLSVALALLAMERA
ncbi:DUF3429 domain-containing protein [Parerythrobacter aestuarii]|uniref:DUF3429 domain-containing protein n=1 Tax=Parerythrobacter aestuarii TaxID=3020909 RepID=UPI0024DE0887|nr:DUF3429 domain-containing protein [Parerythrobacter aestuarii]